MYDNCYIQFDFIEKMWYIHFPDDSLAWETGYKTDKGARRMLEWLRKPID